MRLPFAQPQTFLNLLYDTINSDVQERQSGDFHQGSIENFRQFHQIIARYIAITKDRQIFQVPWEKIFSFQGDKIDINYASAQLLSIIAPQIDSATLHRLTDLKVTPFESKEENLSLSSQLASLYDNWFFTQNWVIY